MLRALVGLWDWNATISIESMNYQLRKVIKSRGHFPSDTAAVKMLCLAICNIEDKRARERFKGAAKQGRVEVQHEGSCVVGGAVATYAEPQDGPPHLGEHLRPSPRRSLQVLFGQAQVVHAVGDHDLCDTASTVQTG